LFVEAKKTIFRHIFASLGDRSIHWDSARAETETVFINCCPCAFGDFVSDGQRHSISWGGRGPVRIVVSIFLFTVVAYVLGVVKRIELGDPGRKSTP
jgi:hypothetical protein